MVNPPFYAMEGNSLNQFQGCASMGSFNGRSFGLIARA